MVMEFLRNYADLAEDTVQEAYVASITEDETDPETKFLEACRSGDKFRMKIILQKQVIDANTLEEGSGNTGTKCNNF